MDRSLVTFEDVAIYFTRGEWERLNEEQKSLYKEVMNDNYQMILSLNRPDIILNIDLGYEPYVHSHSDSDGAGSWQENNKKDKSSSQPCCPEVLSSRCEPQVKRQRRYPRVNPFRWIKKDKDKKKKKRFSHSSHRISRRAEDKRRLSRDYALKTFPKGRHHDSSTCISQDSTNNIQEDPLHDEPTQGSKDLNSDEDSDDGTAAECSHPLGEAIGTCEKQEAVLERCNLTRAKSFTVGMKNCEKPTEGSGLAPNLDCSHREDDIDLARNGDISDSKDNPVSEISDSLMEVNSGGLRKLGTQKTETQKEERRSITKKKESHHKKDRHVKFNEVVTMILIEQKSEEQFSESLEGGVKLQSTRLPIFNNENEEGSKKKAEKRNARHDIEEDRASKIQSILHRNVEGAKQRRKRSTVSSSQTEELESCHSNTTKCSKKRIVKEMGTSQRAPELEALSPSKKSIKERHDLNNVEMNDSEDFKETYRSNMKSEDGLVDTGSGRQPKPTLNNQKSIKSYTCLSCGKVVHWSKLSIHQKESIEKSIAITCRICAVQTSSTPATAPAQTICPLSFTTHPSSSEISQPINLSKKISACSSAQPHTERILSAEKTQTQDKDGRNETTTEKTGSLVANNQKMGVNTDHCKKALQTSQDSNESKVCSKCENLGASLDPKVTTFTASSASNTSSAATSPPGLDSSCNKIGIKNKKVASKSVEQPKRSGDSREYVVCAKCGDCFVTKQRNDPSSNGQQKKLTKSPSLLQKTQAHPHGVLKTCPSFIKNIRNPSCIVDHESPKSDKDNTKCGKSLANHVTANPENPDESGEKKPENPNESGEKKPEHPDEKNCVLHLKKKRKQLLEEMEPFQCKECGKIFTCHLTLLQHRIVHTEDSPYSCKECGKSFQDSEFLKRHMRVHTKEKLKLFIESVNQTSNAYTSSLGQDSSCSRIGTKYKKVAFKSSVELPRKTQDSKEHEGYAKYRECSITEQRNGPSSSDRQKKPTKSSPSKLQKTQDHSRVSLKTHSTYVKNMKNPRRVKDPDSPKSDKKCTKCGKSLAKHVNRENPSEGSEKNCILHLNKKSKQTLEGMDPYQCKKCGKTFTRHFSLMQHRTVHTGERPFSCKECGKAFRDGGYLKIHMRLHTKEKPYTCPECGKLFGQHSALAVHLRTHTDERPFQCNVCGKSFGDRSTFRHHQMIHTGEKPFTCSFCGKKFTQQAHVKRHEKMHTGERPFGCTMCEKRFIDRTKLRKHELTHNRGKV